MSDEAIISLHALAIISSPQTLKIRCFIKHRIVVALIDSGNTHYFVHKRVVEVIHYFVWAVSNFQVLFIDEETMKFEGCCENIKL